MTESNFQSYREVEKRRQGCVIVMFMVIHPEQTHVVKSKNPSNISLELYASVRFKQYMNWGRQRR